MAVKMITETHRILKPNGIILFTSVLRKPYAWYWRRNFRGEIVMDETHLREYRSIDEFTTLFTKTGFEIISCKTPLIRYPIIDPIFKVIHKWWMGKLWTYFPSSSFGNALRLMTRIPIFGYHSIEVIARKSTLV